MNFLTLVVTSGPLSGTEVTIQVGQSLCVGRGRSSDLVIMDPVMSRRHFQLRWNHERFCLVDLQSSNGTTLNRQRVAAEEAVGHGDVVAAGCTSFCIRLGSELASRRHPP